MELTEVLIICNISISIAMAVLEIFKVFRKSSCTRISPDGKKTEITLEMTPAPSDERV